MLAKISQTPKPQHFEFSKNFLRLDPGNRLLLLDQMIRQHGYKISYQRFQICACVREINGLLSPQPNCKTCKGVGRIYLREIETTSLVTSISSIPQSFAKFGTLERGTISATFLSTLAPSYRDRFRLIDVELPINQNFDKTDLDTNNSLYLDYFPSSIISVGAFNTITNSVIMFNANSDYILDIDNKKLIIKYNNMEPLASFSVLYLGAPYYYITQLTHAFRGLPYTFQQTIPAWLKLPSSAIAKRGDLQILEDSNIE